MEDKKVENKNEETVSAKGALILVVGAYVLGCFAGAASSNKRIKEAYSQGVMDTFQSLIKLGK